MSQSSAQFTGDVPRYYDRCLGPQIFAGYANDIARRCAASNPAAVLETAAGTGFVTRALRDALPVTTSLIATDLNVPMLEIAREKFNSGEAVVFREADATNLPFADSSFDAVVCQFGVMFFPDKDRAASEVHRVLRPGGRYHFNVWDEFGLNPFARIAHETAAAFFARDPPGFFKVPFGYYDVATVKASLETAGFTGVSSEKLRFDADVPSSRRLAEGMVRGSPLFGELQSRGAADPEHVVVALTRAYQKEFGADPGRMPLQAIVFEARKV
jgi:SAM-dependent methyltransferase